MAVEAKIPDAKVRPNPAVYKHDGRWTNGANIADALAAQLNVNLTSYAIGGAKIVSGNYFANLDYFVDSGLLGQISRFRSVHPRADPNALFFLMPSANDYFQFLDYSQPLTLEELAENAAEATFTGVSRLLAMGAKHVLVSSMYDLSSSPYVVQDKLVASALEYSDAYDAALRRFLRTLPADANVRLFDWISTQRDIARNHALHGVAEIARPCQPVYPEIRSPCDTPEAYLWWDEFHMTARGYAIVAGEMVKLVQRPE
jgi:phospholipase/lecithinase/hemolysin